MSNRDVFRELLQAVREMEAAVKAHIALKQPRSSSLTQQFLKYGVCPCYCHTGPTVHTNPDYPCCPIARMK